MKLLDSLVRSEAVKHVTVLQQRHHLEIEAYLEQMRLKDEKLEALQWQLLSAEFETKRLESNIERLNKEILHLRHGHMSMEPLLLDRGGELSSFKGQCASQLISQDYKNINNHNCSTRQEQAVFDENRRCSQVKVVDSEAAEVAEEEEEVETQIALSETAKEEEIQKEETLSVRNVDSMILLVQSPENEFEEKEVTNQSPYEEENMIGSPGQHSSRTNNSELRMDLHALGVSYKIKRLKQQLSMLERLIGKQQSDYEKGSGSETELFGTEHFHLVMCLNKQVGRYHSLQSKIDDLCQRMVVEKVVF